MAFLDDLGKKVSEVSARTIQKTKELTDTSRLNVLIADEEKAINSYYSQIGKLYYTIYKNDYAEEFSVMIDGIVTSESRINAYREEIQNIKGVQKCEKCGAEVMKGAAFCSSCGATLPKEVSTEVIDTISCMSCGAILKKEMHFCTVCGKEIEKSYEIITDVDRSEECEREIHRCSNCGEIIDENMMFCTECGTKVEEI